MNNIEALLVTLAGGESKWADGTRVRIIAGGDARGMTGTVRRANFSERSQATDVILDGESPEDRFWFADYELEALEDGAE
ncbi:hypothetical protein [Streptomyces sp. CBMA29]|uniref:hypothetical protein n=1 Tax=Streptomyces sp. CBMA29 TaxID=1896314 RepID=UPI001662031A|nr:hypothetical protein [Streptomyces sp. CBMA29]MBD0739856.1 hypothetical protein [Streptomyces sp. CBMA29]